MIETKEITSILDYQVIDDCSLYFLVKSSEKLYKIVSKSILPFLLMTCDHSATHGAGFLHVQPELEAAVTEHMATGQLTRSAEVVLENTKTYC